MHIFLAGLLSIVVQVILLRELSAAFYGVDLIYLLALGAWLLWTATGAMLGRRALQPSRLRIAALLVSIGFVVPLEVALIRRVRLLLGGVPGAYLPLPAQLAASALCLLPASVLLGMLFQWTAKRYLSADREGRSLARAYAIESLGGVVGGLATTLTLRWRIPTFALALATASLALAVASLNAARPDNRRNQEARRHGLERTYVGLRLIAAGALLLCLAAGWHARRLDLWMTSWNHPAVVETLDSPYGRLTVDQRAGQITAYENDALVLDSEGTDAEELVHLTLLQHPAPRNVLLVGGAAAGLPGEVVLHAPARIDSIELDPGALDLLARRLPAFRQWLSLPSLHLVFNDPRRAIAACGHVDAGVRAAALRQAQGGPELHRGTTGSANRQALECGGGYDVIIVAAPEPASAQANRFFTREFFELCAASLRPGGLVSLRLASIENLWTPPLVARTGSIYAALGGVFRDVVVLPGSTNIVLASRSPLIRDPEALAERLTERGIRPRMVTGRYVRYLYSNDRFAEIERLLARDRARPNTDANPAAYRATSLFWLSKFVPSFARLNLSGIAGAFGWTAWRSWLLLAAAAACAFLWRRRAGRRTLVVVAAAALAGMVVETLLLLQYQLKHGVMFQDFGVLLMCVMAGLAAGAWWVDWHAATRHPERLRRLFLAALVTLALAASITFRSGYGSGFLSIAVMLFVAGAAVAGVFACASLGDAHQPRPTSPTSPRPSDQRRLVSPLYAADVAGGCAGSIAASLVLVPLLGMPLSAEWAAALAAIALLLAW